MACYRTELHLQGDLFMDMMSKCQIEEQYRCCWLRNKCYWWHSRIIQNENHSPLAPGHPQTWPRPGWRWTSCRPLGRCPPPGRRTSRAPGGLAGLPTKLYTESSKIKRSFFTAVTTRFGMNSHRMKRFRSYLIFILEQTKSFNIDLK